MKGLFLIFNSLFLILNCDAQVTFQKVYGNGNMAIDYGVSILLADDGNFIITGYTDSVGSKICLMKINESGNIIWEKAYGDIFTILSPYYTQETFDGGYIITGTISGFGAGLLDVLLIRTDSLGNLLWSKAYGGSSDDIGECVRQTSDGGYIISGNTSSYGAGQVDIYLIRVDSNGDTLWTKTYGGANWDIGYSVIPESNGFVVFGTTGSGGYTFVLKTNFIGDIIWTKSFNMTADVMYFGGKTNDGGYILTGKTGTGIGVNDTPLIKLDSNGNVLWGKTYNTAGGSAEGYTVSQTSDGGYIIGGRLDGVGAGSHDAYLIKTNANGSLIWSSLYGSANSDFCNSVIQTTDNGYLLCGGWNITFTSGNDADIYLVKTDSNGISECNETKILTTEQTPVINAQVLSFIQSAGAIVSVPVLSTSNLNSTSTLCFSSNSINDMVPNYYNLTISPNPFTNQTTIAFSKEVHGATFSLYNLLGEKAAEITGIDGESFLFNRGNLPSGVYVFEVSEEGNKIYRGKAVVY